MTDSNNAKGAHKTLHQPIVRDAPYPLSADAKKLFRELSESKARLEQDRLKTEAMINSLGEGLIEMDERGHIRTINLYALNSLGFRKDELVGAWFPGVVIAVNRQAQPIDQLNRPLIRALTTGQPVSDYIHYLKKDGSIMPVFVTVSPIITDGRPTGAIEVFRDLTKEQQLDIAKDEFVSLASHQLRTPATGVKLILSMLAKGDFGPLSLLQQRYLDKAIQSNERQLHIIEDLLNVARLDAGKMELNFEYADLVPMVRDIVGEHLAIIDSRHQSVKVTMPKQLMVFIDVEKMHMVIDNLVSNASKYSTAGGKINLRLSCDDHSARLAVHDEGVGMDKADIPRVFTKFTRLDNELSTSVGGTGLGLFLVRSILELHDGAIEVESAKGIGSTFTITLPRRRGAS